MAVERPVHLAIVYHSDGRIAAYRNGHPYGTVYRSNGPVRFSAGGSIVTFGLRHLPANPGKLLRGTVVTAAIYDRALSAEDIAALAGSAPSPFSNARLLSVLDKPQRRSWQEAEDVKSRLQRRLALLEPVPQSDDVAIWTELAHALFNFKEFIYVR